MRVGFGKDLHKLEKGNGLVIGGVNIPCEFKSVAHSDGDALLHAIADSLLGAAALNDIGFYFPASKQEFKNMDSAIIVKTALDLIKNDYEISNVDCVITLETPSLTPYRKQIIVNLSNLLNIKENQISVKFKTNEKLGDIGESKAYSAEAICLLENK